MPDIDPIQLIGFSAFAFTSALLIAGYFGAELFIRKIDRGGRDG